MKMTISINFDDTDDFCYFAHDASTGETWNLPDTLANIDDAITFVHENYPTAMITIGDSAMEN